VANSKILIAYYSPKGENFLNGSIVNLPVGNSEMVAKKIEELTGGDLFEICTVKPYPFDYNKTTGMAMAEKKANARPELVDRVDDMVGYDIIYLGYPNWWGTFPMAVFTFLESYYFSGKTIVPFCTHEGSGIGSSERDIKKLCSKARFLTGIAIRGGSVNNSDAAIISWIERLTY
jgi:flavodoxin